jgi:hypothetical protein
MRPVRDESIEYAMMRTADGIPVPRTQALRELEKFRRVIAQAGGRAPLGSDGRSMVWNEARGWFPRDERRATVHSRAGCDIRALRHELATKQVAWAQQESERIRREQEAQFADEVAGQEAARLGLDAPATVSARLAYLEARRERWEDEAPRRPAGPPLMVGASVSARLAYQAAKRASWKPWRPAKPAPWARTTVLRKYLDDLMESWD